MPLFLKLLSMDEMFHESKSKPIILNDLCSKTEEDREYFNNLVEETFTSDVVSVMPRCQCGELRGEHLIGEVCDSCETPVRQSIEDDISPALWFRRPNEVERLINPIIWIFLDQRFTRSKFRIMQWLVDRHYNPNVKRPAVVEQMIADGIPRGYNNFVQNFDEIMAYLFSIKDFQLKRNISGFLMDMLEITHPSKDPLQQLIADHRDIIFSDYIPVMNRSLLVLEQAATGIYLDNTILDIKDALNTMLSIDQDYYNRTPAVVENRTAKIIIMLTDYYDSMFRKNLNPKEGLFRKHAYGTRSNHAFRAVITSHDAIHEHDEIWIPWCVATTVFQLHLLNWLMKHDDPERMTHNEALEFLYSHVYVYHPKLDAMLQRLIAESPGGRGIPVMNQRNQHNLGFLQ